MVHEGSLTIRNKDQYIKINAWLTLRLLGSLSQNCVTVMKTRLERLKLLGVTGQSCVQLACLRLAWRTGREFSQQHHVLHNVHVYRSSHSYQARSNYYAAFNPNHLATTYN